MTKNDKNNLFDINKFPPQEGILVFGISMNKISNVQNAKKCFEYIEFLVNKIQKPLVGLNFIYSDYLYLNSNEKACVLKNKFISEIHKHKNQFEKLLAKNQWYIRKAFSFTTWNQMVIDVKNWTTLFSEIKKIYKKDEKFQKYLKEDNEHFGRKLDENQLNFLLEEILFFYLISKGKVKLHNEYVGGHEKWILPCYPGKPLKSEIYIFQRNPFKFKNSKNKYENSYYDLEDKKIYDYSKIDLETLKLL